jgi:hypothetical protein
MARFRRILFIVSLVMTSSDVNLNLHELNLNKNELHLKDMQFCSNKMLLSACKDKGAYHDAIGIKLMK